MGGGVPTRPFEILGRNLEFPCVYIEHYQAIIYFTAYRPELEICVFYNGRLHCEMNDFELSLGGYLTI